MNSRRTLALFAAAAGLVIATAFLPHRPRIFLYAWERPEDFSFLAGRHVGVVYYAGSIVIDDGQFTATARRQPLRRNPAMAAIPLVRIDDLGDPARLDDGIAAASARFILGVCAGATAGCQVDFDARVSERNFYATLLRDVRGGLDPGTPLSITALLSWCDARSWLDGLPITEAVPMFYRIGPEAGIVRDGRTGGSFLKNALCARSAAVSLDEPLPDSRYLAGRDIYVFDARSWTPQDFSAIIQAL